MTCIVDLCVNWTVGGLFRDSRVGKARSKTK